MSSPTWMLVSLGFSLVMTVSSVWVSYQLSRKDEQWLGLQRELERALLRARRDLDVLRERQLSLDVVGLLLAHPALANTQGHAHTELLRNRLEQLMTRDELTARIETLETRIVRVDRTLDRMTLLRMGVEPPPPTQPAPTDSQGGVP